jgi:hypothetical protein
MVARVTVNDGSLRGDGPRAAGSMLLRGAGAHVLRESVLLTHGRTACVEPPPDYDDSVLVGGQWTPAKPDADTATVLHEHGVAGSYNVMIATYSPPVGSCVQWRTASQARDLLKGKHLMFIGDSVRAEVASGSGCGYPRLLRVCRCLCFPPHRAAETDHEVPVPVTHLVLTLRQVPGGRCHARKEGGCYHVQPLRQEFIPVVRGNLEHLCVFFCTSPRTSHATMFCATDGKFTTITSWLHLATRCGVTATRTRQRRRLRAQCTTEMSP